MPALIIGANLPDVDAACFFWLEGTEHLGFRRGITHGPIAWVVLPLMLAGLLWSYDRWQAGRGKRPEKRLPVNFKWLFLLSFIACLTHPTLDWLNVYGIRLLEPFSHRWFYGDTLFIVDVWLWALMGLATWFSLRREKRGGNWTRPARIAIAVSLAYIGMNWFISAGSSLIFGINNKAPNHIAVADVIASPVPVEFWHRDLIVSRRNEWLIGHSDAITGYEPPIPVSSKRCAWPTDAQLETGGSQAEAFLFWSRAPFAEQAADGSVILRDARFFSSPVSDRFTVALPDVKCGPIPTRND